jgi:hypothetical protein
MYIFVTTIWFVCWILPVSHSTNVTLFCGEVRVIFHVGYCANGFYAMTPGDISSCTVSPAGHYKPRVPFSDNIYICDNGTYAASGATACSNCAHGASNFGSSICLTPTAVPSTAPTSIPSRPPSATPSVVPSAVPTGFPVITPSSAPSATVTFGPTVYPTYTCGSGTITVLFAGCVIVPTGSTVYTKFFICSVDASFR